MIKEEKMSNYYKLDLCPQCNQMTNHIMSDHPDHRYTAICQKCGYEHEPNCIEKGEDK